MLEKPVEVKLDPDGARGRLRRLETQYQLTTKLRDLRSSVNDALRGLDSLKVQIEERKKTLETQKKEMPDTLKTGLESNLEELNRILDGLARSPRESRSGAKDLVSRRGSRISSASSTVSWRGRPPLRAPTSRSSASEYREKMGGREPVFRRNRTGAELGFFRRTRPPDSSFHRRLLSSSEFLRPFAHSCVFPGEKEVRSNE